MVKNMTRKEIKKKFIRKYFLTFIISINSYIKMYLASKFDTQKRKDQTKINKQKTTIKKKDIDPIFDENFRVIQTFKLNQKIY